MFYKKSGFPEEGEIILCTVKKILYHAVFVHLDEYKNKEGIIYISEISPGRIRNIRDYVKQGKKLVCKVLRVNKEKNHIDLSLRRVNENTRKKKLALYKREQKAEKVLEVLAKQTKTTLEQIYKLFGKKLIDKYGSLIECFYSVLSDEKELNKLKIPKKYHNTLLKLIKERFKLLQVTISGEFNLKSYKSNGIDVIKKVLKKAEQLAKIKKYNIKFLYISAPKYRLDITASDYKTAEKNLNHIIDFVIKNIKKEQGFAEWSRY